MHVLHTGYIFFGSMVEISHRLKDAAIAIERTAQGVATGNLESAADTNTTVQKIAVGNAPQDKAAAAVQAAQRFLLLNMRAVTGMDATAACEFGALRRMLAAHRVTLVLAGVSNSNASVQQLLASNGVIAQDGSWERSAGCPAFDSLDAALLWCQEHFQQVAVAHGLVENLAAAELDLPAALAIQMPQLFSTALPSTAQDGATAGAGAGYGSASHDGVSVPAKPVSGHIDQVQLNKSVSVLTDHMEMMTLESGGFLFRRGDASDRVYIVLSGTLVNVLDLQRMEKCASLIDAGFNEPAWLICRLCKWQSQQCK